MTRAVNIHDAKTNLSKLIASMNEQGGFTICNRGVPVAKVEPITQPKINRLGLKIGAFNIPEDFDTMGTKEIEDMFGGK